MSLLRCRIGKSAGTVFGQRYGIANFRACTQEHKDPQCRVAPVSGGSKVSVDPYAPKTDCLWGSVRLALLTHSRFTHAIHLAP